MLELVVVGVNIPMGAVGHAETSEVCDQLHEPERLVEMPRVGMSVCECCFRSSG